MSFFKSSKPPVRENAPASPLQQPTLAQIVTMLEQIQRRLGRIERDLIDVKAHFNVARRPMRPMPGSQPNADEPTIV
ncbi:MAG: hypothetical protein KatS3mg104_1811 [Phycisphaerae bacterium]|jgi:hypothetical protein|nr:MAG: hypothetical protein KatS3mg104_1811 [Phycisphaerae bacterium]